MHPSLNHPQAIEHSNQLENIPFDLSDEFLFNKKLVAEANEVERILYVITIKENEKMNLFKVGITENIVLKIIKVEDSEEMKKELKNFFKLHHQCVVK